MHVFSWNLKGKRLRCPAFDKFHTKEMSLCLIKDKLLGRVLLDFLDSFFGRPNRYTGVTVKKYSWIKVLPSNYLMGNNYSPSTYLVVNKVWIANKISRLNVLTWQHFIPFFWQVSLGRTYLPVKNNYQDYLFPGKLWQGVDISP